jgi:hypothetical protein
VERLLKVLLVTNLIRDYNILQNQATICAHSELNRHFFLGLWIQIRLNQEYRNGIRAVEMLNSVIDVMSAKVKFATGVVASAMLACSGFSAHAITTYSTSGLAQPLTSLGDTIGSSFDQLYVQGAGGQLDPTTTTIVLNTLTFVAGVNAIVPATYSNYSFSETVKIDTGSGSGSNSATLTVPFNLTISYSDTLTVVGGTTISIPVGSNIWNIVVNSLTIGPNPGGAITEALTAQVSDPPSNTPLPATFLLFGSGLGAMELVRRRKKARETASSGA